MSLTNLSHKWMENTNTLHYESLDHRDLLRIINEQGSVDVLMPLRHAKACCTSIYIAKYFKYNIETLDKSKLHKFGMLLLGLLSIVRNLLFHSKLMEVNTFYVLAKPMKCTVNKIDDKTCLLKCEKN